MFPSDCWDIAVCSAFRTLTQMEQICSPSWCLSLSFLLMFVKVMRVITVQACFFSPLDQISRPLLTCISTIPLKLQHLKSSECWLYTTLLSSRVLQSSSHLDFHHTKSRYRDALTTSTITSSTFAHWCSLPPPPPSLPSGISVVLSQVTKSHCLLS